MTKLGQAYAVLSFLKKEKIDYIFDGKQYVDFPCFYCGNKLTMDAVSTQWRCECGQKGNILTLHHFIQNSPNRSKGSNYKQKIYNPKREWDEITNKLKRSATKHNDDSLLKLIPKVEALIDFHQKRPS